jgi:hypothetical protein
VAKVKWTLEQTHRNYSDAQIQKRTLRWIGFGTKIVTAKLKSGTVYKVYSTPK